jgi:hypothetical protein
LLTINYVLVRRDVTDQTPQEFREAVADELGVPVEELPIHEDFEDFEVFEFPPPPGDDPSADLPPLDLEAIRDIRQNAIQDLLRELLLMSVIALGAMTVVSFGLGWVVAGRMLRPLHVITDTARELSESNLDERIALEGPRDEFKELADTFDEMLARLDKAFAAQREFVANASHELKTPLTIMRTEAEVTLADPTADRADYERTVRALREEVLRAEALVERLLVLARSESPATLDRVDLEALVADAIEAAAPAIEAAGLRTDLSLSPAVVEGDLTLLESMVSNTVSNAVSYNEPGGHLSVECGTSYGAVTLRVVNSGGRIPPDRVDRLFDRFERLDDSRSRDSGGSGLGLSIVRSVARAHRGEVTLQPGVEGGLVVLVTLPAARTTPSPG